jgi:hypothetical protein
MASGIRRAWRIWPATSSSRSSTARTICRSASSSGWQRRSTSPGPDLQAKIGRARDQLLTFCDYPGEVDVTNNTSERKLRPCVIQRKVTNGYRAMWAAEAEADVRTTIDTARLDGANPFAVIINTLA